MTYIPHEGPQADLLAMRDVPEILFGGARGGGKGLCLSTEVMTKDGWSTIGELKVGDTIFDADGRPTVVLYKSEPTLRACYRLTFDNGQQIVADDVHRWITHTKAERVSNYKCTDEYREKRRAKRPSRAKANPINKGSQTTVTQQNKARQYRYKEPNNGAMRSTQEICDTQKVQNGREVNHAIKIAGFVEQPERELPIPPYILGLWLGDGSADSGRLTIGDEDAAQLTGEIERCGYQWRRYDGDIAYKIWRDKPFVSELKAIGLIGNKIIPEIYRKASIEQRLALLQGLFDTDGSCNKDGQVEFCNTNESVAQGVYELLASLGAKPFITTKIPLCTNGKTGPIRGAKAWIVKATTTLPVFRLQRKKERLPTKLRETQRWHYITKVEPIEPVWTQCLTVDSQKHTFLVSKAYIATHNTAALLGDFLQDVARYGEHWQGMLFRRSYPELEEVIKQSHKFYSLTGAYWRASSKSWHWGNGACLRLRSLETREDASKYQGFEASWIGWDELTNWSYPDMFFQMFACLRGSGQQVASRVRCSGNPGGPGHNWVKDRYAIGEHKKGWFPIYDEETNMTRLYIPSRTTDNPSLILNSPNYTRQLRAVGSKELVRAWLEGDWDIVLGAYFDEFNERVHVIDDIELTDLPKAWNIYRAYDHGSYHPFAVLWYTYAGREMKEFEPGTLIILREWFGADENGKGLKLSVADIADGIRRREKDFKREVKPGPADNQIFENDGGMPLSEIMAGRGVYFERSDKRRIVGWNQLRYRLQANLVKFCRSCKTLRLTLPTLQHDDIRQEDVDTTGNDHCFVGDTFVEMAVGHKPISSLPEEGYVQTMSGISFFDRCGLKQKAVPVVEVRFVDGRKVRCTPDHRFMTPAGWVEAKDLMGESGRTARVLCRKSGYAQVRSVEDAGVADVYCMRVPTLGHFCIENGLVVSNCADALRYAAMSWPIEVQTERVKDDVRDIRTFNELIDASDDLLNRVRKPL